MLHDLGAIELGSRRYTVGPVNVRSSSDAVVLLFDFFDGSKHQAVVWFNPMTRSLAVRVRRQYCPNLVSYLWPIWGDELFQCESTSEFLGVLCPPRKDCCMDDARAVANHLARLVTANIEGSIFQSRSRAYDRD